MLVLSKVLKLFRSRRQALENMGRPIVLMTCLMPDLGWGVSLPEDRRLGNSFNNWSTYEGRGVYLLSSQLAGWLGDPYGGLT